MNWEDAKQSTLRLWRSIYDSVGEADPVALLTEINAISDLCAVAKEEAAVAHDLDKCHYCPAYQQFGGCRQVSALLSELVARRDWPELRVQISSFIQQLERMEAPGPLQIVVH
ncbi:MAG TPA: hypothetical protein VMS86_05605 [Thermoanaerobaculia bacterium]|nr:hypothetical protein [Thermoanaerobaculia bacterium]